MIAWLKLHHLILATIAATWNDTTWPPTEPALDAGGTVEAGAAASADSGHDSYDRGHCRRGNWPRRLRDG